MIPEFQPNNDYARGGIILYGLDGRIPEESTGVLVDNNKQEESV